MPFFELFLNALDSILANKLRSFLTALGVLISVLSIILLVSLGDGARAYLLNMFEGLGSNLVQITPGHTETKGFGNPPMSSDHKLTLNDADVLRRRAVNLNGVSGFIQSSGTIKYLNRRRDPKGIFGVDYSFDNIRQIHVEVGRFFTKEDIESHRRYVVLGKTVVAELFGNENALGKQIKINDSQFQVIGISEPKGTTLGFDLDDIVMIPVTTAMDTYNLDALMAILTQVRNKESVKDAQIEIIDILKRRHNGKEDFTLVLQDELLKKIDDGMAAISALLLAIASISLIVGGIGIANIMLVSVQERTREIGIRRAIGAKKRHILLQFLMEAIIISVLGCLMGLGIAALIIFGIRSASPTLPVNLDLQVIVVAILFSVVVGVISGVAPARRAANLDPVDSLRYE